MTTEQTNEENRSSEDLDRLLAQLTPDQIRFVVARQEHNTHKEAAESLDITANRVYQWISADIPINKAVKAMALDGLVTAVHIRKRNLAKAMMVKVAGLDSDSEGMRQRAATEIIEWEMGRAAQTIDNQQSGETVIRVLYGTDDKTA